METIIKERNIVIFGHTCGIQDDRLIKMAILGRIEETQKEGNQMVGRHKGMNRS